MDREDVGFMADLYELMGKCIEILDEIYNLAVNENIEKIRIAYSALSKNVNKLCITMTTEELLPIIIRLMEELYMAIELGDSVKVLDVARFELKPIFNQYRESIGDSIGDN